MRDNIQKIETDWDKKRIRCGSLFIHEEYLHSLDWRYVSKRCGYHVGLGKPRQRLINGKYVWTNSTGTKQNNKAVSEILGMPPKKFAFMLRGAQYNLWIKPYEKLLKIFCMSHRGGTHRLNDALVHMFHEHVDYIEQYEKDNQHHLTPFAFYYGQTTQQLKKKFGKAIWKDLNRNSFSRNHLIAKRYGGREEINIFRKISSSILMRKCLSGNESSLWVNTFLKKEKALTTGKYGVEELSNLANDTLRMSEKLGKQFSLNWSYKKLEKKHEEYTKLIQLNKYPNTNIKALDKIQLKEYKGNRYTAVLLNTPYKIHTQGISQKHCVGSYISNVEKGDYMVYDIVFEGKTVSTLGINKDMGLGSNRIWRINQHYGPCNKKVSDDLQTFANEVLKQLNKEY